MPWKFSYNIVRRPDARKALRERQKASWARLTAQTAAKYDKGES
jgi:hypothetical protein